MRLLAVALALSASAVQHATAQTPQGDAAARIAGAWHVRTTQAGRRTPLLGRMDAQLADVESVFRRNPLLNPPLGFTVLATRSVHQSDPAKMVGGEFAATLIRHEVRDDGGVDASGNGEGLSFGVTINNMSVTWEKTDLRDAQGQFYTPATVSSYHGFPVYQNTVLLTRRTAPTTVPVTRERALRAAIAQFSALPSARAALERELEKLAPAERQQPAAVDVEVQVALAMQEAVTRPLMPSVADTVRNTPRVKSVLPLVVPNPAFYDRTRPGDIQVMTVSFSCTGEHRSPWCAQYGDLFERIQDNVDWQALMALVR